MKSTCMEQNVNDASKRFELVLDGEAVLDKETGLVWEKSPDTTNRNWGDAISYAYNKTVGGRKGWRLPMAEELASLVDLAQTGPSLPSGHPFTMQVNNYWSATTFNTTTAWYLDFGSGVLYNGEKSSTYGVWCLLD